MVNLLIIIFCTYGRDCTSVLLKVSIIVRLNLLIYLQLSVYYEITSAIGISAPMVIHYCRRVTGFMKKNF